MSDGAKLKPSTTWNWTGRKMAYKISKTGTEERRTDPDGLAA
jgi:hypothetical protein